jgi:hypothetical protein
VQVHQHVARHRILDMPHPLEGQLGLVIALAFLAAERHGRHQRRHHQQDDGNLQQCETSAAFVPPIVGMI